MSAIRVPEKACLAHHGYKCAACGFDFESAYGEIGKGFIEIHHLNPLGAAGAREVDPIQDLRPLCPNCHAIVHRREPVLPIEDLRTLIAAIQAAASQSASGSS